jgi:hypothetical protein
MTDELGSLSAPVPKAGTGAKPGPLLDEDRLDELETFALDDDAPDDARVSLPARDVRDMVRLIAIVRAALVLRDVAAAETWTDGTLPAAVQRFDAARVGVLT